MQNSTFLILNGAFFANFRCIISTGFECKPPPLFFKTLKASLMAGKHIFFRKLKLLPLVLLYKRKVINMAHLQVKLKSKSKPWWLWLILAVVIIGVAAYFFGAFNALVGTK
jgi:hypothetical protein